MKRAHLLSAALVAWLATPAPGTDVTFPQPFTVSDPIGPSVPRSAAFNVVDRSWFVVWADALGTHGRIVREDGQILSAVLDLTGRDAIQDTQVAHDPIRNVWMIVWTQRGDPELGEPQYGIRAQRLGPDGAPLGPHRLIGPARQGIGGPQIAVAHEFTHPAVPATPYFIVVWSGIVSESGQNRGVALARVLPEDPGHASGIGLPSDAFRFDTDPALAGATSTHGPTITRDAPQLRGPGRSSLTSHRVAFTLTRNSRSEIWVATLDLSGVRGVTRVTPESVEGRASRIAWNRATARTLVAFTGGADWSGRLFEDSGALPLLPPVSDPAPIVTGTRDALLEAHPLLSTFMLSTDVGHPPAQPPEAGLACLVGLDLFGDPTNGVVDAEFFSVISPNFDGRILLAYVNTRTFAADAIILPALDCGIPRFRRADVDASGLVELTDPVRTLGWLFLGGDEPACLDAADVNDDGNVELSDAVYALNWLFLGGAAPPSPGPSDCGTDESSDALSACGAAGC